MYTCYDTRNKCAFVFCSYRKHINSNTIQHTTVLDDPWGIIKFQSMDSNVILFVDRCCLHYLDVRVRIICIFMKYILNVNSNKFVHILDSI